MWLQCGGGGGCRGANARRLHPKQQPAARRAPWLLLHDIVERRGPAPSARPSLQRVWVGKACDRGGCRQAAAVDGLSEAHSPVSVSRRRELGRNHIIRETLWEAPSCRQVAVVAAGEPLGEQGRGGEAGRPQLTYGSSGRAAWGVREQ